MKNIAVLIICIVLAQVAFAQSNRDGRNDRMRNRESDKQFIQKTYLQPCQRYDDNEYYAASGFIRVKAGGEGEKDFTLLINKELNSLRQQVKSKVGGKYKSVVRDYFDQMDIDSKSTEASHIESAGEQIIDSFLNDTEEDCRELGPVDDDGFQNIYIGILVRKVELVEKLVDGLENNNEIPSNEKEQLKKNENAFRESAFKAFDIK
jgi:hypothetical protein